MLAAERGRPSAVAEDRNGGIDWVRNIEGRVAVILGASEDRNADYKTKEMTGQGTVAFRGGRGPQRVGRRRAVPVAFSGGRATEHQPGADACEPAQAAVAFQATEDRNLLVREPRQSAD